MEAKRFSVWVGGSEVNDFLVTKEVAESIAEEWRKKGYDDVVIDEYTPVDLFNQKWGKNPDVDNMSDEQLIEFKNDCFALYEETGFIEKFDSPYDDDGEHNGMKFKVLRRANLGECDLEAMPIWLVEFENGDTAYCYPEEITKLEHEK